MPASLTMRGEGVGGKTHIKNTPEENLMVKPLLILSQIAELPFLFYLCVQTHPAYNQAHRIPSRALAILSSRRKMFKVEAWFRTLNNFGAQTSVFGVRLGHQDVSY